MSKQASKDVELERTQSPTPVVRIESRPTGTEDTLTNGHAHHRTSHSRDIEVASKSSRVSIKISPYRCFINTLKCSWLNLLLLCIPISWAFHFTHQSDVLIFVFSFLAIIPLAKLLAFATDELSNYAGETVGGLINATFGNAVELIVAIIAVTQCQLQVVQSSLVGSILSNLLLVLGMCFFAGGIKYSEQGFGSSASQINSSLLTLSVIAVLLPAAFHFAVQNNNDQSSTNTDPNEGQDILNMSHGVAIILLFIYASYLIFQLWSHKKLFNSRGENDFVSTAYDKDGKKKEDSDGKTSKRTKWWNPRRKSTARSTATGELQEEEEPKLSLIGSLVVLVVITVLVGVTSEFLVSSIDGVTDGSSGLSKEWVGLILLPIVGNAAEHVTAVTVSVKDKLNLSISVAVGSSIQIALLVIPFIVILAWILDKPLVLLFDPFESVTLFLAVLTVNYVVQDGKSNWLEGMILMSLYVIIGVSFWFYSPTDVSKFLPQCK